MFISVQKFCKKDKINFGRSIKMTKSTKSQQKLTKHQTNFWNILLRNGYSIFRLLLKVMYESDFEKTGENLSMLTRV